MSGSKSGGQLAAARNKAKHGDDFYSKIGSLGGKKGKRHLTHEEAAAMGRIGGTKSRRKPAPVTPVKQATNRQRQARQLLKAFQANELTYHEYMKRSQALYDY